MIYCSKRIVLILALLVTAMVAAACDATPVPPEVEEVITGLSETVSNEDAVELIQSLDSAFDTYQWESVLTLVAEDEAVAEQQLKLTWTSDATQPAQQVVLGFVGGNSAETPLVSDITLTAVESQVFFETGNESCLTFPVDVGLDVAESMHDIFDPTRLVLDAGQLRRSIPNVEINGVEAAQFTFDETALGDLSTTGLSRASGDIFVAVDGRYIVRMELDAAGDINFDALNDVPDVQAGAFTLRYDVVETDATYNIQTPLECDPVEVGP